MHKQTQIVIIGAGASGMAAATAAAEAGAQVIVVEANSAIGGNGLFPRGIFGVDSKIQRCKLIFADRDEMFLRCMDYAHWKIDARIVRVLINKSGDTIDWLEARGVVFTDVVHHLPNQTPEVFHVTDGTKTTGWHVISALKKCCTEKGVTFLEKTRAKKLLLDENGGVTGVLCEDAKQNEMKISAEAVIICTGGFAGNRELVARYFPRLDIKEFSRFGGIAHPGDGHRMAVEAGADVEGNFAMEVAAPKIQSHSALNLLLGKPYNIWVNKFGRRFASESIVYDFTNSAGAIMRQPDGAVWVVFDEAVKSRALTDGPDIIEKLHTPPDAGAMLEATIRKAVQSGILCISDTAAELAEFIGCPADVLRETLANYNDSCKCGHDQEMAKPRRYLQALEHGPYYAVRAGADMLITHGGIRIDEEFHTLRADYSRIDGLYVAGVDIGGVDADVYDMTMSGHGFGFALNSGRIAGETAAKAVLENGKEQL